MTPLITLVNAISRFRCRLSPRRRCFIGSYVARRFRARLIAKFSRCGFCERARRRGRLRQIPLATISARRAGGFRLVGYSRAAPVADETLKPPHAIAAADHTSVVRGHTARDYRRRPIPPPDDGYIIARRGFAASVRCFTGASFSLIIWFDAGKRY